MSKWRILKMFLTSDMTLLLAARHKNHTPFSSLPKLVLTAPTQRMAGWVYKPKMVTRLQMVTHPITNQAMFRVPLLIATNMLPLSQTANLLQLNLYYNNIQRNIVNNILWPVYQCRRGQNLQHLLSQCYVVINAAATISFAVPSMVQLFQCFWSCTLESMPWIPQSCLSKISFSKQK